MTKHILKFIWQLLWTNTLSVLVMLISPVMFTIAYPFRWKATTNFIKSDWTKDRHAYWHEEWHLPKWAAWFDNASDDGIYGSKHYQNYTMEKKKDDKFSTHYKDAFYWAVIRNPINGFKRGFLAHHEIKRVDYLAGHSSGDVNVSSTTSEHRRLGWYRKAISEKRGVYGWYFLRAKTEKGHIYWFRRTEKSGLDIRLGYKIKPLEDWGNIKLPIGHTLRFKW